MFPGAWGAYRRSKVQREERLVSGVLEVAACFDETDTSFVNWRERYGVVAWPSRRRDDDDDDDDEDADADVDVDEEIGNIDPLLMSSLWISLITRTDSL